MAGIKISSDSNSTRTVSVWLNQKNYGEYGIVIKKHDGTAESQWLVSHNDRDEIRIYPRTRRQVGKFPYKLPKFAVSIINKHFKTTSRPKYAQVRIDAESYRENNDCTVVATALVCNAKYEDAHAALKKYGRVKGKGAGPHIYLKACSDLGVKTRWLEWSEICELARRNGARYLTSNSVVRALPPKGKYLIRTHSHLAAVVDGVMEDWTEGRRFRVKQMWEVK